MSGTPNLTPQNYFATSLSTGIGTTDTTIFLASLPTGTEGYLEIDEGSSSKEIIYFTSKGSNFVTLPSVGAGRGVGGTAAAPHLANATVKMKLSAEWWLNLQDGSALKTTALSPVKTANPFKFSAYLTSAQSLTAGAFTRVAFDTENYDTGSNFDSTSTKGRFTVPTGGSGFYSFNSTVQISGAISKAYIIAIYKNGTEIRRGNQVVNPAATTISLNVYAELSLVATDFVEVFFFNGDTGANGLTTGSNITYFDGKMLSAT